MEVEADLTLTVTVVRLGAWLTVMRFGGKLSRDVTRKSKSSPGNTAPGFCSNRAPHKLKTWVELPISISSDRSSYSDYDPVYINPIKKFSFHSS